MSLRETVERIRSNPVPGNEEAAKFRILAPILAALSWDPYGQDVLWEHPVGGRRGGGKVDIALRADGHIWALIEAKAPGTSLDGHVEQVLRYAHYEGVDICALSDGLHWWLYLPRERGSPEARRFAVMNLTGDPLDQLCDDLSTFLGRESLVNGSAVAQAEQVRRARREAAQLEKEMPQIWAQMLNEPDAELIDLVRERVYKKLSLRPERDQIIAAMRSKPIPPAKPNGADLELVYKENLSEKSSRSSPMPPPTAIRLWDQRHPVKAHYEVLITVVEQLYLRHGDKLETVSGRGGTAKYLYASHDRTRVLPKRARQTPSGLWVDINLSAQDVRKRASRLLEALGHSETDLEYLYDD